MSLNPIIQEQLGRQQRRRLKGINRDLYIQPKDWQQTEKKRLLAAWLDLRNFRLKECDRLKIDLATYSQRLAEWQYLRRMMERERDRIEAETNAAAFDKRLSDHRRMQITRKAEEQAQEVIGELGSKTPYPDKIKAQKIKENFGRIMPPIS